MVGTGLTMVDVALSLADSERPASLLTVSRKGLLPRAHTRTLAPGEPLVRAAAATRSI